MYTHKKTHAKFRTAGGDVFLKYLLLKRENRRSWSTTKPLK
jgi:hypothetical protein